MLISDHPHLFEVGGENYHTDFYAWDYERGHESDPWKTRPDDSWIGAPLFGRQFTPYDNSRGYFKQESDFPGPRTMAAAARWIDKNAGYHDRFFLLVDEFDPHEPFDTPEPYASMYDDSWHGPNLIWPPYMKGAVEKGVLSEREARQVRASYGAKLTMIDHWFGKVIDAIERHSLWDDTVVIVCTDHGHYLGEKDIWGKPGVPAYEPLGHIPLMIAWPGVGAGVRDTLTSTIDIFATIADVFDVDVEHRTHGKSLVPLVNDEGAPVREFLLSGVWGREVHLIDGRYKYARAPDAENAPLSLWSNRWSTMPIPARPELRLPAPDDRATLDRMPGSRVPVIRQPFQPGDLLPYWAVGSFSGNHLYDLHQDPDEEENLADSSMANDQADRLRSALIELEAPADQLRRLGLA